MKLFILEDDPTRIAWFAMEFWGHSIVWCNNVADALPILKTLEFHFVFLDHDLDGKVFEDSLSNKTGAEVTRRFTETINMNATVVLHSLHEKGRIYMKKTLEELGVSKILELPFGTFSKGILYN